MSPLLLYKNIEFDLKQPSPWNEKDMLADLDLDTLFKTMAGKDDMVYEVVKKSISTAMQNDAGTIFYRQEILKDCITNSNSLRALYDITVAGLETKKTGWLGVFSRYPSGVVFDSVHTIETFVNILHELRSVADENSGKFSSEGFKRFFKMLRDELTDDYLAEIKEHLNTLQFKDGMLISYNIGKENKGINPKLHAYHAARKNWLQRLFGPKPKFYTFYIHPRDESGARALSDLKNKGINLVADALGKSVDHILHFFIQLQTELAFYIGCLNLYEQLQTMQAVCCFPEAMPSHQCKHSFANLYDVCLALKMHQKITGNEMNADDKNLVIITGANQGGKSTFLRSVGIAQLMMQSGLFVPAAFFHANISAALITHFKREEDVEMKSGKLDEELSRMNVIAEHLLPASLLLFNESFAATNELEGSEIAGQVVRALTEKNLKVFFVTHMYEFAQHFYNSITNHTLFLRAERKEDTSRTFKLVEAKPLETSFGIDVYNKVFGDNNKL